MKDLIESQPEQDIEHCDNCIHGADSVDICVLRKCKYAIAELIDCYEPKQLEQPWIPCSERQPEERGFYLTTTKDKAVYCDHWNEDNFDRTEMVIAWMPLPEPYKGGRR